MWVFLLGLLQKNGSDYPKPSSELGCQQCRLDYDNNYLLSSQEFQLIPHVKSTRASCRNDREIGPKISWFGAKAMLFRAAPAKSLSWNQKFIRFPAARVNPPLRGKVPQDYLQLQRWCQWFDSHAANNYVDPCMWLRRVIYTCNCTCMQYICMHMGI
jgi:hypothetical protein